MEYVQKWSVSSQDIYSRENYYQRGNKDIFYVVKSILTVLRCDQLRLLVYLATHSSLANTSNC